ncbi:MAG: lysophospholipase [Candidatus Obscuribacterales bacterium]|nr:lysophospholipase [Candidatus Obscuribacterales bacterium]
MKNLALSISCALLTSLCPANSQLMEMDKEDLPPPVQEKSKQPEAGVTPMMSWIDEKQKPKAYLVCIHGLGLHKGAFTAFAQRMNQLGFGVYAVDIRGFGSFHKDGDLSAHGHIDFPGALKDVEGALKFVRAQHPGSPVYLVGESMGGGISLQATSLYPNLIDGLICCVPAGERYNVAKDSLKVGLHLLGGAKKDMDVTEIVVGRSATTHLAPGQIQSEQSKKEAAEKQQELETKWIADLNEFGRLQLSPVELMAFQSFMDNNHKAAKKIATTPVLMMQGVGDALVKHEGQEELIQEIPSKDSKLVFVDQARHLILEEFQDNDPDVQESVIQLVSNWLNDHVAK